MSALDTNHIIHYSLFTIHYSFFCITNAEKGVGLV